MTAYRAGADGELDTADDVFFDTREQLDDVLFWSPETKAKLVEIAAGDCGDDDVDPWTLARVENLAVVNLGNLAAPTSYSRPSYGIFNLGGTEFWQRWPGGHDPTHSFSAGTDAGRRCMQASAIRFETIMANPPQELIALRDNTNWSGSFYNWNDDYTQAPVEDAAGAELWAWSTGLIKWISQTAQDGSCHLPTRDLVIAAAIECAATGAANNGEIKDCWVY